MSASRPDPYLYPGTTVLKNKLNVTDQSQLDELEVGLTITRFAELLRYGTVGPLNAEMHKAIHKHLFGDLYPFAGQYRTIDIHKEGETPYSRSTFLDGNLKQVYQQARVMLAEPLSYDDTIDELVRIMGDLHVVHPFREGNTRTVQIAIREIAWRAGIDLDWSKLQEPKELRKAGTAAALMDFEPYNKILKEIGSDHGRSTDPRRSIETAKGKAKIAKRQP